MSTSTPKRILALDIRPRSFGYVVFEGPDLLLDWGAKSFRSGGVNAVKVPVAAKFARLLQEFAPSVIVMRQRSRPTVRLQPKLTKTIRTIQREAEKNRVPVRPLDRRAVLKAFGDIPRITRYQIASILANRYPELGFRFPPKRKPWQSEDYRMSIFDAAALGIAYFERNRMRPSERAADAAPPTEL